MTSTQTLEPGRSLMIGVAILAPAGLRRPWLKPCWSAVLFVALVLSSVAVRNPAHAWTNPGDSCADANPMGASPWDNWVQQSNDGVYKDRGKYGNTTNWRFPANPKDVQVRITPGPASSDGEPFTGEGPYCRTTATNYTSFSSSIQYKVIPGRVTPKGPKGMKNDQDFGNSGIYIFDRWEVQIIDPNQFDDANNMEAYGKGTGVPQNKPILPDLRMRRPKDLRPNDDSFPRNTMVPGAPYDIDIIRDDKPALKAKTPANDDVKYVNLSNSTGQWNTLDLKFCPPILKKDPVKVTATDPTTKMEVMKEFFPIDKPASLTSMLNGKIIYCGPLEDRDKNGNSLLPVSGTGSRGKMPGVDPKTNQITGFAPSASGPIFLVR